MNDFDEYAYIDEDNVDDVLQQLTKLNTAIEGDQDKDSII